MNKLALSVAVLSITPLVLKYYYKRKLKLNAIKQLEEYKNDNGNKYLVIFVTKLNRTCLSHMNRRVECSATCSYRYLKNIVNLINTAKQTLQLCVYHLTLESIHMAVMRAKERGVLIQCISDYTMTNCSGSKIKLFQQSGIEVRTEKTVNSLVHHKFLIIDGKTENRKLLFGSMNYTINAFLNNWENLIYTNDEYMVERFLEEFNEIWNQYKEKDVISH